MPVSGLDWPFGDLCPPALWAISSSKAVPAERYDGLAWPAKMETVSDRAIVCRPLGDKHRTTRSSVQPPWMDDVSITEEYSRQYAWRSWPTILDALPDVHGQLVLDLGSGIGDLAADLAARGAHVIGFDINE